MLTFQLNIRVFSRSGALGPGRVGSVMMSQLNIGHIDVICMFGLY